MSLFSIQYSLVSRVLNLLLEILMDPLSLVFFFLFLVSKKISQGLTHPQPTSQYAHISSNRSERGKDQLNTLHHFRSQITEAIGK